MQRLQGKHVVVGVSGSIAAYRALDLIRRLKEHGASVRVCPTRAALAFVTPLSFEALSGAPVLSDVLEIDNGRIPHIEQAYGADLFVVAPASADILSRMAQGAADEALLATLLSYRGPLLLCPAMETRMWEHPATQANIHTLIARGATVVAPAEGTLASGRTGTGRLADVELIVEACEQALAHKDLAQRRILVTAGPTVEDIDPARYLSNRSSGAMGVALARAAALRGATVELVHGPMKTAVPKTPGITASQVRSARDMHARVHALLPDCDGILMCAAVADMRPANANVHKLKKGQDALDTLTLIENPDILKSLSEVADDKVIVGFAAETRDVEHYAHDKCKRKRCDLVVANDVSEPGSGFDVDTNRVFLAFATGAGRWLEKQAKANVAENIIDELSRLLDHKRPH